MHQTITDERNAAPNQVVSITQALAHRIGPEKYRVWFGCEPNVVLADGCLKIAVPNAFTADWIQTHYLKQIIAVSESVLGYEPKVNFKVIPPSPEKGQAVRRTLTGPRPKDEQKASQEDNTAYPQREARLTLDRFVVGPSNELAFNAAKAVVRETPSPFNPLFIHGGYGVGKTHLLQGICHEIVQLRPRSAWLYLSAEDFANQFVTALKNRKLEEFRRRIRQLDLLAIDDIHFLANKPSTQEEFFHTFNTISLAGKQVVLASDAPPKMIKPLSEKLINRFVSGMVVKVDPPDFATRCKICRQYILKVAKSMPAARGPLGPHSQAVPENVIQYIAENIRASVRELEGAILKVMAYAALNNDGTTLETARQALADHVERHDPVLQVSQIESAVATHFSVNPEALRSTKKDRTVSLARHFCMYLARRHTRLSCVEVGKQLGNKNHATVLVACKRIADLVGREAEIHWQGPSGNKVAKAKAVLEELEARLVR